MTIFKRGDILTRGEKILFFERELEASPGFMIGVMLEAFNGKPLAWSIDNMEGWVRIAEQASIATLDIMQRYAEENPPPKRYISKDLARDLKAFCGVDVPVDMIEDESKG